MIISIVYHSLKVNHTGVYSVYQRSLIQEFIDLAIPRLLFRWSGCRRYRQIVLLLQYAAIPARSHCSARDSNWFILRARKLMIVTWQTFKSLRTKATIHCKWWTISPPSFLLDTDHRSEGDFDPYNSLVTANAAEINLK